MTVTTVALSDQSLSVSGSGYRPDGGFRHHDTPVTAAHLPRLRRLVQAGALCNDASLNQLHDHWQLVGDPMEGALLTLALKAGESPTELARHFPRLDEIPFDSRHQYMATLHHDHKGHHFIVLKGAPERVIALCKTQRNSDGEAPINRQYWLEQLEQLASRGQRVLAIASGPVSGDVTELDRKQLFRPLSLLGLVGLLDPPREAAVEAVTQARNAGIQVKMITGDHVSTARSIGAQLGLDSVGDAVSGPALDGLAPESWRQVASRTSIFARATPEHKLRLVEALQSGGHIVAMTGDGVNDAPALKRADIGIAMGRKGTEAAREAAAMVLADDNFESITRAILEGRAVFDNLRKAVIFFLPINGGESASIMLALLLGLSLPIEPLQLLWVNMVSSVCLALVLAFEKPEPDIMQRPPRSAREPLVSGFLIWRVSFVSALFTAGIFGIYELAVFQGAPTAVARTMAVNTLAAMEVFYLFSVRYLRSTSLTLSGLRGTPVLLAAVAAVILAQLMFSYAPWMHDWFASAPLSPVQLALPALAGTAVFIILELEKLILGIWRRQAPEFPEEDAGDRSGGNGTYPPGRASSQVSPGRHRTKRPHGES
jgi:magnesium-transporting ATPase (P-type)